MGSPYKILLCEDDPGVRESVSILLKIYGYEVEAVDHAGKVDNMLSSFAPNLLLIDLWLPNMSGDECVSHIRKTEKNHLPIILFSANTEVKKIAHECGADDFIIKPFEIEELEKKLSRLLTSGH